MQLVASYRKNKSIMALVDNKTDAIGAYGVPMKAICVSRLPLDESSINNMTRTESSLNSRDFAMIAHSVRQKDVIVVCNYTAAVERKMHALFAFARMDFAMGAVDSLCKSGGHVLRLGGASGVTRAALPHRSAGSEQRFDPITCRNLSSNQQYVSISLSLQSVTWLNSDLKCFHEFHRTHETRVREIRRRDSQLDFRTDSSTSA
jgi:hypothetical protein